MSKPNKLVSILLALLIGIMPVMLFAATPESCAEMEMALGHESISTDQHIHMDMSDTDPANCHSDDCASGFSCASGNCVHFTLLVNAAVSIQEDSIAARFIDNLIVKPTDSSSLLFRPPRS